ncbi:hypothetical protein RFI_12488 [Reticulomyxa filosa]|uniref:Uncharacterized protein n=1 Tax=Reticulomyxa filosa TaxID=46433 RepID=X6NFX9_RETFI|nr:hypothetical protein RFI_12488 [Reticulomyxa filosa]|eukprot:ETO24669.1 hypothetical protein RFI_12488 [Reticulomyxa filosa]
MQMEQWLTCDYDSGFKFLSNCLDKPSAVILKPPKAVGYWCEYGENKGPEVYKSRLEWDLEVQEKINPINDLTAEQFDKEIEHAVQISENIKKSKLHSPYENRFAKKRNLFEATSSFSLETFVYHKSITDNNASIVAFFFFVGGK